MLTTENKMQILKKKYQGYKLSLKSYFLDELQFIDWEIDSDREDASECKRCEDSEGAVEISDCASCASSRSWTSDEKLSEPPKVRTNYFKNFIIVYNIS